MKKLSDLFDRLVDAFIQTRWQNRHAKPDKVVKVLLANLRDKRTTPVTQAELIKAFYRLIDFHCMEHDFVKGEDLCHQLLQVQAELFGVNDPRLDDTYVRITRIVQYTRRENQRLSSVNCAQVLSA
ncbi:MAG: hypothetical protein IAF58_18090 [Leptolyngbya sp.]|nr:hypothetical protein [Candidatus Melainabacteria bacterium]